MTRTCTRPARHLALLLPLLGLGLVFVSSSATAARPRVAVLTPAAAGRALAVARSAQAELLRSLGEDGVQVVSVDKRRSAKLRACRDLASCTHAGVRQLRADYLLVTAIQQRGRRVSASVRLIAARTGVTAGSRAVQGKSAGAGQRVAQAARQLVQATLQQVAPAAPAVRADEPVAARHAGQAVDDEAPALRALAPPGAP